MSQSTSIDQITFPEPVDSTESLIAALSAISGVPAFHMQAGGAIDWESPSAPCFCAIFGHYNTPQKTCPILRNSAADAAAKLGEPYVFLCPADMILFACPSGEKNGGTYFIGPLPMDHRKEDALEKILSHFTQDSHLAALAGTFLAEARVWEPQDISSLYKILFSIVRSRSSSAPGPAGTNPPAFADDPGKRTSMPYTDTDYPEDPYQDLLKSVQASDTWTAIETFRLFYEKTYLMASGNFDTVRMQIIEMFNFLSGRLGSESATSFFLENLEHLSRVRTFNDAYMLAESMLRYLTDSSIHAFGHETPVVIRQALHYIGQHYDQEITLTDTARQIHISPSYFSMLFKKETGKTFTRFLTDIRLENACRYLRETDQSITEISTSNGFSSQSYFIRVFRQHLGMTPKQYRKKHRTPEGAPLP